MVRRKKEEIVCGPWRFLSPLPLLLLQQLEGSYEREDAEGKYEEKQVEKSVERETRKRGLKVEESKNEGEEMMERVKAEIFLL